MNKHAQSTLELVAVITFVTICIFVIGPTVIRGVNAHFKLWDDSIQDSHNDPMNKAPEQDLPVDCQCTDWIGGPGERCAASPCLPTQRLENKLCNPVGCGTDTVRCVDDSSCCDSYQDTDMCCIGAGATAPLDCPVGSRVTQRPCGGGVDQFSYRVDSVGTDGNPSCVPKCLGTYSLNEAAANANPISGVICPNDDTGLTPPLRGLPPLPTWDSDLSGIGINVSFIGTGVGSCSHPPSPPPDNKCEVYCLDGYHPFGNSCSNDCHCPEGYVFQGSCGSGNIFQDTCPTGYYMMPADVCAICTETQYSWSDIGGTYRSVVCPASLTDPVEIRQVCQSTATTSTAANSTITLTANIANLGPDIRDTDVWVSMNGAVVAQNTSIFTSGAISLTFPYLADAVYQLHTFYVDDGCECNHGMNMTLCPQAPMRVQYRFGSQGTGQGQPPLIWGNWVYDGATSNGPSGYGNSLQVRLEGAPVGTGIRYRLGMAGAGQGPVPPTWGAWAVDGATASIGDTTLLEVQLVNPPPGRNVRYRIGTPGAGQGPVPPTWGAWATNGATASSGASASLIEIQLQ